MSSPNINPGTKINLAVVGSRTFRDFHFLDRSITGLYPPNSIGKIISGGANGTDTLAERFAEKYGLDLIVHLPDWTKHGRSAGYIRNKKIVNDATHLIAFWDGKSLGTKMTLDLSEKNPDITTTIVLI